MLVLIGLGKTKHIQHIHRKAGLYRDVSTTHRSVRFPKRTSGRAKNNQHP